MRLNSQAIYKSLCEVIPGGVNSAARAFKAVGGMPMVGASGRDDLLIDADGNAYIDFCCSWGPLIHGHTPEPVLHAVREQLEKGMSYGVTTAIEEKLARKIVQHVPGIETIRFTSSGTEATLSAQRLAMGFTGRKKVVKFEGCYHGHADSLILSDVHPYNDTDFALDAETAAVIVEPIAGNQGVVPATPEFLQHLRDETERVGALLIFDEVITGFRVGLGGAQELYGITPDLTCLGKIIGGGFPVGAFGGRREIMAHIAPLGPVYQAGTLSGNPVAMAAGFATLELCEEPGFYTALAQTTTEFLEPVKELATQVGSMFTLFVDDFPALFWHLFENGIYFPPSQMEACFISTAHTPTHLKRAQSVIAEYCKRERVIV